MSVLTAHALSATLHNGSDSVVLDVKEAEVALDDAWAPYCQARLTITTPPEADAELMDPRDAVRVEFTLANAFSTRDFDLTLHARTIDHETGVATLLLASDEKQAQDYALVDDEPSTTPRTYQTSLRAVINNTVLSLLGAALEADAGADFDCSIDLPTSNLITNPSNQGTAGAGFTAANCSLDNNDTSWAAHGSRCINLYSATGTDSRVAVGGDSGAMRLGMAAGRTYVFSATGNVKTSVITGASLTDVDAGTGATLPRQRALVVHTIGPTSGTKIWHSSQVPNVVGTPSRVSVEFTIPADATQAWVRAYHGGTGGQIRWDAFRLSERTGTDDATYFDGSTTDTDLFDFAWSGTANDSVSTRTGKLGRSVNSLTWEPGEKAWDFLEPLVQASGLRLYCDEVRHWHLVDPTVPVAGQIQVTEAVNLTRAVDTISRDAAWYDAVVIEYQWLESGAQWVEYDAAGIGNNCLTLRYNRPYPGRGAAAAVLNRAQGKGRVLDIAALSGYTATPGMALQATLPETPIQTGVISSVAWSLPDGLMVLGSKGLTDTPETAWVFLPDTDEWTDSPIGGTWIGEVV